MKSESCVFFRYIYLVVGRKDRLSPVTGFCRYGKTHPQQNPLPATHGNPPSRVQAPDINPTPYLSPCGMEFRGGDCLDWPLLPATWVGQGTVTWLSGPGGPFLRSSSRGRGTGCITALEDQGMDASGRGTLVCSTSSSAFPVLFAGVAAGRVGSLGFEPEAPAPLQYELYQSPGGTGAA